MATIETLSAWAGTLPVFEGSPPRLMLILHTENWTLYFVEWSGGKAVLKHFLGDVRTGPLGVSVRRAEERARSEVEGLQAFGARGLAPELLWVGDGPDPEGGSMVLYRWIDGHTLGKRSMNDHEIALYAGALHTVHSDQISTDLVSPQPANLEKWWDQAHASYRELPYQLLDSLPDMLRDTLGKLTQAVSADAQAHKRFWGGAARVPVHGSPLAHNLILRGQSAMLVDWHRFGMGDPAYEIARVCCMAAPFAGEEASDRLVACYLEQSEDDGLRRRIEIFRRVWPYGRIVFLLSSAWNVAQGTGRTGTPAATLLYWATIVSYRTRTILPVYGWPQEGAEKVAAEAHAWFAGMARKVEQHVG